MSLKLENGAMGLVSATRFASGHHNDLKLRLYGDMGVSIQQGKGYDLFDRFVTPVQKKSPCQPDFDTGAQLQSVLDVVDQSSLDRSKNHAT